MKFTAEEIQLIVERAVNAGSALLPANAFWVRYALGSLEVVLAKTNVYQLMADQINSLLGLKMAAMKNQGE